MKSPLTRILILSLLTLPLAATVSRAADKDLEPRVVSFSAEPVRMSKALEMVRRQTGMEIVDRRGTGDDPELKLPSGPTTFWQAVDAIARAADARLGLYEPDGKIALVRGPWRELPVSYRGLFRLAVQRVMATRDLETGAHSYRIALEVAWEPRFRPFLLETRPRNVVLRAGDLPEVKSGEAGGGLAAVERPVATVLDIRLPALPRTAPRIGLLRGELSAVGTPRLLTFELDTLSQLRARPEARRQTREGVTIQVSDLVLDADRWTVEMTVENPPGGPEFESFQSWVAYNEMTLVNVRTGKRFPNNGSYNESTMGNRAVIRYHFVDEPAEQLRRDNPENWKVVYQTPARVVQVPIPFEFKDLPLP